VARAQPFSCGLTDGLLAEAAGVGLDRLHFDVEAICRAADAGRAIAERLGIEPQAPHLAGFAYPHVSTLGCEVTFPPDSEPGVRPCIRGPEDIDALREPDDYVASASEDTLKQELERGTPAGEGDSRVPRPSSYLGVRHGASSDRDCLARGVVPRRLATLEALKRVRPDAANYIGHPLEGPVTTAVLLMGSSFFLLAQDDPARAHRLLRFSVESGVHYARAISSRLGGPIRPGPKWVPDDFAGMFGPARFGEFVAPYWDLLFERLEATERHVHSELLQVGHLPFLAELKLASFDPSADQYLTPELLRDRCPVPFSVLIKDWEVRDLSATDLQRLYRRIAACEPVSISFTLPRLADEPKIRALLDVARELA